MDARYASAVPRKKFFLEMFTRDITLEECIMDLIDNSIDGLIRSRNLNLDAKQLLSVANGKSGGKRQKGEIEVEYDRRRFRIGDNCGGITRASAETEVFNFGHTDHPKLSNKVQLGAYGIGLKRALFKIGDHFEFVSRTSDEGFKVTVDVRAWSKEDRSMDDWRFPIEYLPGAVSPQEPGTEITITKMSAEIQQLLNDKTIESELHKAIAQTYGPFLARYVDVSLNGQSVVPRRIPLGASEGYDPAVETWTDDGVQITLIAGLAERGESNEWRAETAGWYVLCNGRVIVAADKTELTGWGGGILPHFHSGKSRGFVGIASFTSRDPLKLPWTTTKRSLNKESTVFLRARDRMASVARPVHSFLDSLQASKSDVTREQRTVMSGVSPSDLDKVVALGNSKFAIHKGKRKPKTTVKVQFDAEVADLELVRKRLRKPSISATQIGQHVLEYFIDQEGLR